MLINPASNCTG